MLELAALILTIGAISYYIFHVSLGVLFCISGIILVFIAGITRSRQGVVVGGIVAGLFILGAITVWRTDSDIPNSFFGPRAFDAKIISTDKRLDRTVVIARDELYRSKIQLSVYDERLFLPGDRVAIRGEVVRPENFLTDTGRVFEYKDYLASKNIVGLVRHPIVGPVTSRDIALSRLSTEARYMIAHIYARYVSFPFDGVLAGMVVGYQGGLPASIQEVFKNTGVLHVLVLSGYNITLLAGFLAILLKRFSFRIRNGLTVFAIIALVCISGAGVASVRAGIMGIIAVFAGMQMQEYRAMQALTMAYILFFFLSPTSIFIDPGFHLSFLATFFMIAVMPKIKNFFLWIPQTNLIDFRELFSLACSIPFFMLPYMMYFSGTLPLITPITNILFALLTPIILISGVLLLLFSWVTPFAIFLGMLFSVLGKILLQILFWCSHLFIWNTPLLTGWGVCCVYSFILLVLFYRELSVNFLRWYRMLRPSTR